MPRVSKQALIKLQTKLKTDQAIGDKFGISRQAIHQLSLKYGLKAIKNKNKDRNKSIRDLYCNGMPVVKISKKTGLCISQLYRLLR